VFSRCSASRQRRRHVQTSESNFKMPGLRNEKRLQKNWKAKSKEVSVSQSSGNRGPLHTRLAHTWTAHLSHNSPHPKVHVIEYEKHYTGGWSYKCSFITDIDGCIFDSFSVCYNFCKSFSSETACEPPGEEPLTTGF